MSPDHSDKTEYPVITGVAATDESLAHIDAKKLLKVIKKDRKAMREMLATLNREQYASRQGKVPIITEDELVEVLEKLAKVQAEN